MLSEGILLGLAAALGWGIADFFAKIAATREKNYLPIHISAFCGFLIILLYDYFFPPENYPFLTILPEIAPVAFLMAFGWWLFYLALQRGKVSVISTIGGSYGLITLLLAMIFLGEAPSPIQILGALILIASVFSLSLQNLDLKKTAFDKDALLAVGAMVCWGVAMVMLVPFAKAYPPQVTVLSHTFFSFIITTLLVISSGRRLLPSRISNLLPSILASTDAIGLVFYYIAAATFFTSLLAPISSIYPIFTVILAYLFLKERLEKHQLISVFLILLGIFLISW
ncbi:MAG: DMT family transporter [Candidatus Micrarchaeota archaeon]